jgi:alkylhydroperoxidase family enzyme
MAWIKTVDDHEATGLLAQIYDAARNRAGRVWNILRLQSINPPVLETSIEMYLRVMHGPSPLSRGLREMIATVVSRANHCHY